MDYDTRQVCDVDPAGRDIAAPGYSARVMCQ